VKVEVWSDVVCPWCYIGKRRLEAALLLFEHRDEVEVEWRSFELDPSAERGATEDLDQRLAGKYGVTLEAARAMSSRVSKVAAGEGLAYRLDIARSGNTFDAHRLVHLARTVGLQGAMKERLMAAYFTEGRAIGEAAVLAELAAEVGLERERVSAVLGGEEFSLAVRSEEREAGELGISGVPFFVIDRRYGVSGAQPGEVLHQALETAWRDQPGLGR